MSIREQLNELLGKVHSKQYYVDAIIEIIKKGIPEKKDWHSPDMMADPDQSWAYREGFNLAITEFEKCMEK
jgi:hypothetical protein